jgi:type I restriction enzyme S subunit
MVGSGVI